VEWVLAATASLHLDESVEDQGVRRAHHAAKGKLLRPAKMGGNMERCRLDPLGLELDTTCRIERLP
jgi:hypothetical protein